MLTMNFFPSICGILCLLLLACGATEDKMAQASTGMLLYSTNDSARHYFQLGWHQIMDEGRYGLAEATYRKSLSFDPDFLIGKATLGRLTLDTTERLRIERELTGDLPALPEDERSLLGLYTDFVRFTNLRERDPVAARAMLQKILPGGQEILGLLVHKYPEEVYLKCEYIELINSNKGAKAALDSLRVLTEEKHGDNPFLLGFRAELEAELGNYQKALEISEGLATRITDKTEPKAWATYAAVYLAMDSLDMAKEYADRAVSFDPRNLDASRLQAKIDALIAGVE